MEKPSSRLGGEEKVAAGAMPISRPAGSCWSRVLAIALASLAAPFLALPAAADEGREPDPVGNTPQFTAMSVAVVPEFDRPSVLVTYQGELTPGVTLPLKMQIHLPADAEAPYACSLGPTDEEQPKCVQATTKTEGDGLLASFEVTTLRLYLEYYYGTIVGTGQRDLNFTFQLPYPVEQLDIFMQQPQDATDFKLEPTATKSFSEQGFQHYIYSYADVAASKPVAIRMTYARPTDEPQSDPNEAAAAETAPGQEAEEGGVSLATVGILAVVGLGVLGVVLYRPVTRRLRQPAIAGAAQELGGATSAAGFCRHCGQRFRQGATFCAMCGQQARLPLEGR